MKTILKKSGFLAIIFFAIVSFAQAQQNPFDIQFPIAELGNCSNANECKVYCDDVENIDSCIAWAEDNGFSNRRDDAHEDDKFKDALLNGGPGGCDSPQSCDAFCSQTENHDECFAFARDNNLISPEELKRIEAERRRDDKRGPGGCSSREECDAFCRNPENSETCLLFAVEEGNMSKEDADHLLERMKSFEDFRDGEHGPRGIRRGPRGSRIPDHIGPDGSDIDEEKARTLLETVGGPGGCSNMDECEVFCSAPGNDEACMAFAIEHELIPEHEIERMRKMMSLEGPGGCRGRECETFCLNDDHAEECLAFAIDNELIPEEEIEQMKKFMDVARDGGPGGCKGQACEEYCMTPEHAEECFAFAKDKGLFPEHELALIEKDLELLKKIEDEGGPGGCSGEAECQDYCNNPDNIDECMAFAVDAGIMPMDMARDMMEGFIDVERFGGQAGENQFGPPHGLGPNK